MNIMKKHLLFISALLFLLSCSSDDVQIYENSINEAKSVAEKNYTLNRHEGKATCDYNIGYVNNRSFDLEIVFAPALEHEVSVRVKTFVQGRKIYEEIRSPWSVIYIPAGTTTYILDLSCRGLDSYIDCSGKTGLNSENFKVQLADWKYRSVDKNFDYKPFNNEDFIEFPISVICFDGWVED